MSNIYEHQEVNTVKASVFQKGISSRAYTCKDQEVNRVKASSFQSGIDSRPIYVNINISRLVKLVHWYTL